MVNFEMTLKRVNNKYYVNDVEVSKDEYLDAETILDDYSKELTDKIVDDLNEKENAGKYGPWVDVSALPISYGDTLSKRLATWLKLYQRGFYGD